MTLICVTYMFCFGFIFGSIGSRLSLSSVWSHQAQRYLAIQSSLLDDTRTRSRSSRRSEATTISFSPSDASFSRTCRIRQPTRLRLPCTITCLTCVGCTQKTGSICMSRSGALPSIRRWNQVPLIRVCTAPATHEGFCCFSRRFWLSLPQIFFLLTSIDIHVISIDQHFHELSLLSACASQHTRAVDMYAVCSCCLP